MATKKQSESVPTSSGRVLRQRKSTTGGEKVDGKDKGKMPVEVKEMAKGIKSGANEAGNGENSGKRKVITHAGNAEVYGSSLKNSVMIQPIVFLLVALTAVASPTITSQTITSHTALTSTAAFASQTITSPTASTSCSPSTHVVAVSPSAPTSSYCSYQFLSLSATPFPDSSPIMVGALILTAVLKILSKSPKPNPVPIPRGPATVRFPKNKKPFPKLRMTRKK